MMTGKEGLESLKETLNNVDNITFYQEEINAIQKELDQLDYYRKDKMVIGDFEKGKKELWWEHIRIIVDDKVKEIWQDWEGTPEDKAITLNECLKIAKKELGYKKYKTGVILIICESYLKGIIYRYGNYANCKDFEIAGRMHGFA